VAIEVVNRQRAARIERERIIDLAQRALALVGKPAASVTIAFVRDRAIRELNREFRRTDRATDVLSFPAREKDYLGDVVISTDTAMKQAGEAGFTFEREVSELVLHGLLHLVGYDHETDNGEMNRLELKLRRKLLDSRQLRHV
jgi:probable rRNA maturation factor